jgi:hypothetical protein
LKEARLISDRAQGTRRIYEIDPHGLGQVRAWLDRLWDEALLSFKAEAERAGRAEAGEEMNATIQPAPVRKTIVVAPTPQRRSRCLPRASIAGGHARTRSAKGRSQRVVIEERVGGRWYGVDEDGTETNWGDVLVWSPPERLVLAWRIAGTGASIPIFSRKSRSRSTRSRRVPTYVSSIAISSAWVRRPMRLAPRSTAPTAGVRLSLFMPRKRLERSGRGS